MKKVCVFIVLFFVLILTAADSLFAQNFWQQTNGPFGGIINCLTVNSAGHVFAGTIFNGIYRSTDNGATWTKNNAGLTSNFVGALAINASGHLFAGTTGVFRSTNNGDNWAPSGLTNVGVGSLAINSSGHLFAGAFSGVFRSTNNGDTWTQANTGLTNVRVQALAISSSGNIFAGTFGGGVFRSTDNGDTWTAINNGLTDLTVRSVTTNLRGDIFVGTETGLFRFTDNGNTWTKTSLPAIRVWSLAVNINGDVLAGIFGVWRSTDNGDTWAPSSNGMIVSDIYALAVNSRGEIYAGTLKNGVFRSTDNGGNWIEANTGMINSQFGAIVINTRDEIFAGPIGGVYRSFDNGNTWTRSSTGLTNINVRALAINASEHIFAGTDGGVFRSTDNGNTWVELNTGLTNIFIRSLKINAVGILFVGTFGGGVFRSSDNGANWTPINTGLTNLDMSRLAINSSGHLFVGTETAGGIFRSLDNGANWTPINTGLTNTRILAVMVNSTDQLFAGTNGGGAFRSTNNGDTWTPINTGLTDNFVLSFVNNVAGEIFAGTTRGVFRFTDNRGAWKPVINTGLINTDVRVLAINSRQQLFVGSNGGGIFRSLNSTIPPAAPAAFVTQVVNRRVALSWRANTEADLLRYYIYRSVAAPANTIIDSVAAGMTTYYDFNVAVGSTYFYRISAVDSALNESNYSNEANATLIPPPFNTLANTAWPMFRHDVQHTGRSPQRGSAQALLKWSFVTTGAVQSSPALAADGTIYAGATDNKLYAVGADGKLKWAFTTGDSIISSPALGQDGTIFAGSLDNKIYAISSSGQLKWAFAAVDKIWSSPAIDADGDIYVGALDGRLYALDTNGQVKWFFTAGKVYSSPAIGVDGTIYVGSSEGNLYALNENGTLKWSFNAGGVHSSPAIGADSTIYAGSLDGRLYAINANGQLRWTFATGKAVYSSPAIATDGTIYIGSDDGKLYALNRNGELKWSFTTGAAIRSSPTIDIDGNIYVGSSDKNLYAITPQGGLRWSFATGNVVQSSPAIGEDGTIYAGSHDNKLYAVGPALTLSKFLLDFRKVGLGQTKADSITLTNSSATSLNVSAMKLTGSDAAQFRLVTMPFSLLPRQNRNLVVTFTPTRTGGANVFLEVGSDGGNASIFLTGSGAAPNEFPVVTHTPIFVQDAGQRISIAAEILDDLGLDNARLSYRKGGEASFIALVMQKNNNIYSETVPGGEVTGRGVEYFFTATDQDGLITRKPDTGVFAVQVNVLQPGLVNENTQPSGSEQTAYRLISAPLDLDNKNPRAVLEDDLGPYNNTQWRFYGIGEDQRKIEFPNTAEMSPGKGFWLIVKDAGKRISTGAGKSNLTSKPFAVALHPKWNLIGNPFNFAIPLSNLNLKSTGQPPVLRSYTGSWNNPATENIIEIQPFQGYAIFNSLASIDTLFVDPDLSSSTNAFRSSAFTHHQMQNNKPLKGQLQTSWFIRILAQCQQARDIDNIAAVSANASNTHDELDRPEPPMIGEYVSVYFPHPEWAAPVGKIASENYCTDIRPWTSDGGLWTFEVKTNIRDVVQLSFDGLDSVPPEFEIWLMDDVLKISQNLREQRQFAVAVAGHGKRLKLVIGKRDFIDKQIATVSAIPSNFELSQNFPNPFNPVTTIRYGLPREERVTLKVYNLFGQEVATLINNELKNAGYHAAIWDGRNNSGKAAVSGVYFVRLRVGPSTSSGPAAGSGQIFVQTRKMVLVE